MANVLLIEPSVISERYLVNKDLNPHGGLLQLGTILKKAGHRVTVVHVITDNLEMTLKEKIKGVDIVGITFTTFQIRQAIEWMIAIKNLNPSIKVIGGGPHVSATNGLADYFDLLIKGEADITFLDLVECQSHCDYVGVLKGNTWHDHCIQGEQVKDLDSLPYPDLSLVDINKFSGIYPPGPLPQMNIMCSRGCPSQCSFCSASVFGKQVRFRSPEYVIEEIEQGYKDHGIKEAFFQDDTFNVNPDYAKRICQLIIDKGLNKRMVFRARLRANQRLLDTELLTLMKRANFWLIFYGIESGSQIMLNKMRKRLTIDEIKRAFRLTREAGIKVEGSFIIGLPGENELTINQSIQLYHELKPDWCSFNRAIPFPGTLFESQIKEKNHNLYDYEDYELNKTLVRTDELDASQLEEWAIYCDNLILKSKIKRVITHPKEAYHVLKDSGIKGISKRLMSLAK